MRSEVRDANKSQPRRRLGLIVNPIAGLGGPLGLKGTDDVEKALLIASLDEETRAHQRTRQALARLFGVRESITLVCAPGRMGADLGRGMGFSVEETGSDAASGATTADDTRNAAAAMADIDLLIFAGGDGTARDIFDAAPTLPMAGIPTGVKMHSAVFAATPAAAGNIAALVVGADPARVNWRQAEVMDIDEAAIRSGRVATRLYGYARSPAERTLMQNCKSASAGDDRPALEALAARLVAGMEQGRAYVLGCGETMRMVKRRLGGDGTLLGVDVALDGRLIATDVDEARLLRLTDAIPTEVIVSVTGGQGFLFGRGNQQISAQLLRRVARDDIRKNITVITGEKKLIALDPACLRVDTGEPDVDALLSGYIRVHTAPGRSMMMRVAA